jgi:hypothetical protein
VQWNLSQDISDRVLMAKQSFVGPCFMEVFACVAWNIWKTRNDLIFQNHSVSFGRWRVRFRHDLMLHQFKVKAALVQPLIDCCLTPFPN